VQAVTRLFVIYVLMAGSMGSAAQEWHSVGSSFCSQIKAYGAKVSQRPFSIFAVPNADSTCCSGLILKIAGRTEDFGHFRVLGLEPGRYFISFDLKTKTINVPISVEHVVDKKYVGKDCEPDSRITINKTSNQITWEQWVNVD
jgi:hypothetical protein